MPGALLSVLPVIDHVGIAVPDLSRAQTLYAALLGPAHSPIEEIPEEGVRALFFGAGAGRLELLEPTRPDSPIARFLERRGPGLHHICLRVPDLTAALRKAETTGAELIPPGVRRGAGGRRVAFLHPRTTGGILLELLEAPEREADAPRADGSSS